MRSDMNRVIIMLLLICVMSCSPRIVVQRDTVERVNTIYKETLKDTVIYVDLPHDSLAVRTLDTTSVLSTKIATSTASVSNGILLHTLSNRTDYKPKFVVKYKDIEVVRDSLVYIHDTKVKEVERKLSWWQRTMIGCGYVLLGIICALLVYLALKICRKFF